MARRALNSRKGKTNPIQFQLVGVSRPEADAVKRTALVSGIRSPIGAEEFESRATSEQLPIQNVTGIIVGVLEVGV